MTDLFKEVVPAILQTKKNVITVDNEKEYNPFIINRALSYHYDCILFSNEMNKMPNTDKLLQFHYLLNTIRSYKRPFQKWHKKDSADDIDVIKEYYQYSDEKAKEAMKILSNDQINEIRKRIDKGGLNDKSKRTRGGDAK